MHRSIFVACNMKRFLILSATVFICLMAFSFQIGSDVRPEMYFSKGKIPFQITSENGAVSYSKVDIQTVVDDGRQVTISANDNRFNDQHNSTFSYRMNFCSDSVNWCVDAINHVNTPVVYSSNYILVLTGDSLVYPYAMKVGDTLLPAWAAETKQGTANERKVQFTGRKVIATESIGIAGEQLQAFKIECKLISTNVADYGALGTIPTVVTYDFTEWFVPSKGVVKSTLKSKTGVTTTLLQ